MPAQKRPMPPPPPPPLPSDDAPPEPPSQLQQQEDEEEEAVVTAVKEEEKSPSNLPQEQDGSCEGEGGDSESEDDEDYADEFVVVKLADIRKEVQCPICLGIIRKTRTVMECLHRFCRACIDKSMRLGNNECPACRTHCASRRSLRDDPNYDALIAALYPDIDKYEEEELSFHEEEMYRNKKLQESIAEIFRRQSEAVGKRKSTAKSTAAAFVRRSQGSYRNYGRGGSCGRDATAASSDDDDDDEANANDIVNNDSSADEPSPDRRPKKRRKRWSTPRSSPAKINAGAGSDDNVDNEANREHIGTSLQAGSRDILAWGKNGARSQTRHGNMSGLNGRMIKGGRITKLVDYLRSLDDNDDELDVYLTLVPLDKERVPNLEQLNLCCRPTLSIRHLCNYIALQTSIPSEEVQIYTRTLECGASATNQSSSMDTASSELFSGLQKLEEQESLLTLYNSFLIKGELVLIYHTGIQT
ncbi:putative E3 ubiquitin-protein ligase RING1a isoform X1 [Zingiber officinale]|uniref:putative E3 ubiquitin-protein ligase RING1a isoform X1 n=1 Tax=Zingiber officinale TaxID=94328 RepID=UPI001C4AC2F4|nr:putative E3 ubiquitin-protein ligase RING1a isoform X1 [Zingiber officinale]